MFVNKFNGRCNNRNCSKAVYDGVPAGTGFTEKKDGRYITWCRDCVPTRIETAPVESNRRELTADGKVFTPYEPANLPLVKAMPGARFVDKFNGGPYWSVSLEMGDRDRLLELADKLKLTVSESLRSVTLTEQATAADTAGLYPFQVQGVNWMALRDKALLGDDMGCVDGEAILSVNRAGRGFKVKLADAYNRFHNNDKRYGWDSSIPTYCRALCGGELRQHLVKNIIDKGVRPVLLLTLKSGKTLRLTPDHEVAQPDGVWTECQKLNTGDKVLTNGVVARKCADCDKTVKYSDLCRSCVRKGKRNANWKSGKFVDGDGYVRVSGKKEHPRANAAGQVYEHVLVIEESLGRFLDFPLEEVHHKNENRADNRLENLEVVTKAEHNQRHKVYRHMDGGTAGRGGKICFVPKVDEVVSVVPDGETRVFDIVMDDPHRNFVANGIIVHNCGKTVQALRALPKDARCLCVVPACVKYNWRDECNKWRPDLEAVVLNGKTAFRWPAPGQVVIINYDVLPEWLTPPTRKKGEPWVAAPVPDADRQAAKGVTLICDECFPYETPVLTESGYIPIGKIVEEEIPVRVASFDFSTDTLVFRPVTHYFKNYRRQRLVTIHHEYGTLTCTENHEVWVEGRGYVQAIDLWKNDRLRMVRSVENTDSLGRGSEATVLRNVLLCQMADESERIQGHPVHGFVAEEGQFQPQGFQSDCERKSLDEGFITADESTQSDTHGGNSRKNNGDQSRQRYSPCVEREAGWKRATDRASENTTTRTATSEPFMGTRTSHNDKNAERVGVSHSVQGGYRTQSREGRGGDRREGTQYPTSEETRRQEAGVFEGSWVDRVEVHEQASTGTTEGDGEDHSFVYCLEVDSTHNFFASDVLVSNCHLAKNFKAKRSKKVKSLTGIVSKVWALTGTPLLNRPSDLFGVLDSVGMAHTVFGNFKRFMQLFNACEDRWGGISWGSPDPIVPELLRRVMLRRTRAEVLPDLPSKTYSTIVLNDIPTSLRKKMDSAWEEFGDVIDATDELPPFEQFSEIRADLAESRIEAVTEYVENCEEQEVPLVVFCVHRAPIDALATRPGWATITGDTKPEERQNVVRRFQGGELKGVGLTIAAGGVGLTLTRAWRELFVDLDWTPANNLQAEDRCCRIGQESDKVEVVRMVSDHILDQHVLKLLDAKMAVIRASIDGTVKAVAPTVVPESVPAVSETEEEFAARMAKLEEARKASEANAALIAKNQAKTKTERIHSRLKDKAEVKEMPKGLTDDVRAAFRYMLGVCDGAEKRDGQGFNKPDAMLAHYVLASGLETPQEVEAAYFLMVPKYRGQLAGEFPKLFPAKVRKPRAKKVSVPEGVTA